MTPISMPFIHKFKMDKMYETPRATPTGKDAYILNSNNNIAIHGSKDPKDTKVRSKQDEEHCPQAKHHERMFRGH